MVFAFMCVLIVKTVKSIRNTNVLSSEDLRILKFECTHSLKELRLGIYKRISTWPTTARIEVLAGL